MLFRSDLAQMYGVTTGNLNKAVSRNISRFPEDFMFSLTRKELRNLIFQFGISSWGGTRSLPRVFTEHGILMLSSVLNSERAVQVNIAIMRTFVRLRQVLSANKELAQKLNELEKRVERNELGVKTVFEAIRELMSPFESDKKKIGFLK